MKSAFKFSLFVLTTVLTSVIFMYRFAPRKNVLAYNPDFFVTVWNSEPSDTLSDDRTVKFLVREHDSITPLYDINWDCDNPSSTWEIGLTGEVEHIYPVKGIYTICARGVMPWFLVTAPVEEGSDKSEASKLLEVKQWGTNKWRSMRSSFANTSRMRIMATDTPDLSEVKSTARMFQLTRIFNEDISRWDTSNVSDMSNMFNHAESFNQDISNWDTSNVINMREMFRDARAFNGDISSWDTSKVTDMSNMLNHAENFNKDIGNWNTTKVTNMRAMFGSARAFNQDISRWDTSKVTDMASMFSGATVFNQNIGNWDTSKVTNMSGMFYFAENFNKDIGNWNTTKVTNMRAMFGDASSFNQDISRWDTSKVTDMSHMFAGATVFNQNIGDWDTSEVINMAWMFVATLAFNQDISRWDTSKVTNMSYMFYLSPLFNQDIGNWDTSLVTDMEGIFLKSSSFNQDLGIWNVENVTNLASAFNESGLSHENYDKILMKWSEQNVQSNVPMDADGVFYCKGKESRDKLISSPNSWIINDRGEHCSPVTTLSNDTVNEGTVFVGEISSILGAQATSLTLFGLVNGDGDEDNDKFNFNSTTGELSFLVAPDFNNPTDLGDTPGNNTYSIRVRARDDLDFFTDHVFIIKVKSPSEGQPSGGTVEQSSSDNQTVVDIKDVRVPNTGYERVKWYTKYLSFIF